MSSRDTILAAVNANQPSLTILPDLVVFETAVKGSVEKFIEMVAMVGGETVFVAHVDEVTDFIKKQYAGNVKIVSPIPELKKINNFNVDSTSTTADLHDVEVAILKAHFGVSENGAVWVSEENMGARVLPFICQHLIIVFDKNAIVPTMHDAYTLVNEMDYGFGTFIAGPSKTADIEQSLVIGAHGPRSATIFLVDGISNDF